MAAAFDVPIIREAMLDDIDQIAPLLLTSLDTFIPGMKFSHRPDYDLSIIRAHLAKRLFPAPSFQTFCLELFISGEILSYVSIKTEPSKESAVQGPELDMLFVKAGMGDKGYGGKLMEYVQREWKDTGLWLYVSQRNEGAVKFYRSWGFEVVGEKVYDLGERGTEKAHTMKWSPN